MKQFAVGFVAATALWLCTGLVRSKQKRDEEFVPDVRYFRELPGGLLFEALEDETALEITLKKNGQHVFQLEVADDRLAAVFELNPDQRSEEHWSGLNVVTRDRVLKFHTLSWFDGVNARLIADDDCDFFPDIQYTTNVADRRRTIASISQTTTIKEIRNDEKEAQPGATDNPGDAK